MIETLKKLFKEHFGKRTPLEKGKHRENIDEYEPYNIEEIKNHTSHELNKNTSNIEFLISELQVSMNKNIGQMSECILILNDKVQNQKCECEEKVTKKIGIT